MPTPVLLALVSPDETLTLRKTLEGRGYEVHTAGNGHLALEMADSICPEFIICDAHLPEVDGYQLTTEIKASPKLCNTAVILVTGMGDTEDIVHGLSSGADSFLLIPSDENHVLKCIDAALKHQATGKASTPEQGLEVAFRGNQHVIRADPQKAIRLLLLAYESSIEHNTQLLEDQIALKKRAAEALNTERFLDSMIESNPNLISIKDAKTLRYTRVNRAFEALTGIERDEVIGKTDQELFIDVDADLCLSIDKQALDSRSVLEVQEAVVHTRKYGERVLQMKKIAVQDDDGTPSFLLGISEDVTLRRAMESLVRRLNATLSEQVAKLDISKMELEASNKDLESFSYSVAHDLRSPLSVIGGYVGLLEKRLQTHDDEKGLSYLGAISKSVKQMDALINDLLAFSKLARQALKKSNLDMDQLVRKTLATVLLPIPHDRLPAIDQEPLPSAKADGALLSQVWINLISNAVKYSSKSPHPRIQIRGRRQGSEVIYSVQDNGAGFDMAQYERLFGIFQRLHTSQDFEGTGIGLAIVHRVVMHHGGRVWAEGAINKGATFYFSLPD